MSISHSRRVVGTLVLVVASLLAASLPAAAASATGKNSTLPAATKTTYSISGTVLSNASSAAVQGVDVVAQNTTTFGPYTYGSATTNASGAYTISHILPGSYNLRFDPPRATNLQHGYRNNSGPLNFSATTPSVVTISTASRTGMNVRLPAGFKISGKVTRSNGTTVIPNVEVGGGSSTGSDTTTTDSSGNYTLMGLSPGSYEVSFGHDAALSNQTGCWYTGAASKFSAGCASHTSFAITSANVTGISPKIPNGLEITGYVKTRAATPAPIVGATVNANGPEEVSANTDATGKYTIKGLNPGSYKIEVDGPYSSSVPNGYYNASGPFYWTSLTASAPAVTISAAITTLHIIKPGPGYFIKGKITDTSGTALASVLVQAVGTSGPAVMGLNAFTNASGIYSIGPVPAGGSYKISASPFYSAHIDLEMGWYRNSPPNNFTTAKSSALSILVNANKNGINMRLPMGASISGIIHITGGSPCNGCVVFALDHTGTLVAYALTTSAGAYKIQGLSAGSYHVEMGGNGTVIDATHVRIVTGGFYKSGPAPNFSPTLTGATAIAVSP